MDKFLSSQSMFPFHEIYTLQEKKCTASSAAQLECTVSTQENLETKGTSKISHHLE